MSNIVSVPYERSQLAPQYVYTDAMYKQDYYFAHWFVYSIHWLKYPERSITKEDLLQWCLIRLWQKRPDYDPSKGKYTTWAKIVCLSVLRNKTIVKRQQKDAERYDLDATTFIDDMGYNHTFLDTVGEPDKEPTNDLISIIYQAVDNIHVPVTRAKAKQVIDLLLSGKVPNQKQAAVVMGCTRERVRQLIGKVRQHALQILANGNMFSRQEYERQLVITQQTPHPYIRKNHYYVNRQKPQKPRPIIDIDLSQCTFKQLYRAAGFTQQALGEQVNVDQSTIGYWSRCCCHPKPERVYKLAEIFNCTYEQMQAIILRTS